LFADQGNKLPFSVCSKQIEVAVCCKRKLPLFIVFRIYIYIPYINTVPVYGIYAAILRNKSNVRPGDFPWSVYHLLILQWQFVVCSFVDEGTNRSYLFANGLNRLNGLAHL
jgi:hypothetical protein